jgi:hypothetical protein
VDAVTVATTLHQAALPTINKLCQTPRIKNLSASICLSVVLLFGCTGVCKSASYQKSLTANESGDFATVLREWKPLAAQGSADLHKVQAPPSQQNKPGDMIEDGIKMILNSLELLLKSIPQ